MKEIFQYIKIILINFGKIFKVIFRGWHIRKFINFSNFLKLFFIYIFAVIWVIFIEIDYSKHFWTKVIQGNFSDKRFSFYSVPDRIGEAVLYDRMISSSDKVGYDYSAMKMPESLSHFSVTKHFYYVAASLVNYIFKPKFNLALTHHVNVLPLGYNITYLNMPLDSLYDRYGNFSKSWSHLYEYDAYVDLYSLINDSNELLENIVEESGKDKPIIALYISQDAGNYTKLPMDTALITGTLWGCNRDSLRMSAALKKLADEELLVAIGLERYLGFLGDAYLGKMEDFGNVASAIVQQQQKYGIALITHNQEHMLDGIPTSRIGEAAGNGALIISDKNLFLTKFFGDSVLYFDAFASTDEIYSQVKAHIKWAQNNPEQAYLKTQKAYKIFVDNFTMEKQLNKLFEALESSHNPSK